MARKMSKAQRQARKRVAVKRQLRRAGVAVPGQIGFDIGALRRLRSRKIKNPKRRRSAFTHGGPWTNWRKASKKIKRAARKARLARLRRRKAGLWGGSKNPRGRRRNIGGKYELYYGTGGHGGPYPDMRTALKRARALIKGHRAEHAIHVVDRGTDTISATVKKDYDTGAISLVRGSHRRRRNRR